MKKLESSSGKNGGTFDCAFRFRARRRKCKNEPALETRTVMMSPERFAGRHSARLAYKALCASFCFRLEAPSSSAAVYGRGTMLPHWQGLNWPWGAPQFCSRRRSVGLQAAASN